MGVLAKATHEVGRTMALKLAEFMPSNVRDAQIRRNVFNKYRQKNVSYNLSE
jgi:hypothetical protein